jgi:hypothetical protein
MVLGSARSHGLSLLHGSIDVTEATASPRIGNLTAAFTSLDPIRYHPGNVCCSLQANIVPNSLPIEIKAVAELYRVLFFLNTHPNPKLILGDYLFSGC